MPHKGTKPYKAGKGGHKLLKFTAHKDSSMVGSVYLNPYCIASICCDEETTFITMSAGTPFCVTGSVDDAVAQLEGVLNQND